MCCFGEEKQIIIPLYNDPEWMGAYLRVTPSIFVSSSTPLKLLIDTFRGNHYVMPYEPERSEHRLRFIDTPMDRFYGRNIRNYGFFTYTRGTTLLNEVSINVSTVNKAIRMYDQCLPKALERLIIPYLPNYLDFFELKPRNPIAGHH